MSKKTFYEKPHELDLGALLKVVCLYSDGVLKTTKRLFISCSVESDRRPKNRIFQCPKTGYFNENDRKFPVFRGRRGEVVEDLSAPPRRYRAGGGSH